MWSVGCIFAELMQKQPLFPGRGEIDQIGLVGEYATPSVPSLSIMTLSSSRFSSFLAVRTNKSGRAIASCH